MADFSAFAGTSTENKEKSKFYIKIGATKKIYTEETDTTSELFVTLPQPLYLDSMKKNLINGKSEYANMLANGNALLEQLLKKAESLKPGEDFTTHLEVRVYRRKENDTPQTGDVDFSDVI